MEPQYTPVKKTNISEYNVPEEPRVYFATTNRQYVGTGHAGRFFDLLWLAFVAPVTAVRIHKELNLAQPT